MGKSVAQRLAQKEAKARAEALEALTAELESARSEVGDWYCIRAAFGQARRCQRALKDQKLTAYLPMQTRWIKHARRKIPGSRPLLGRYLFVKLTKDEPRFDLVREGVESLIGVNGRPSKIPASFVMELWEAEVDGEFDATRPTKKPRPKFQEGDQTVIKGGVLDGCSVIVLKVLSERNIRVLYTLFGRDGEAVIDAKELAPLAA